MRTFAILLFFSLVPAVALADGDRRLGARLFRQGERHYDDDEYTEALASFEASLEAFEHPATQFNIALCLEKLGRLREADEMLEKVQNGNRRRIARKARFARTRIASAVPTLRVDPGSDGAQIAVDGQACPAPCERRVDPGSHEVVVADRGREHRETVDLHAGQTFQLSLERYGPGSDDEALEEEEDDGDPGGGGGGDGELGTYLLWGGVGLSLAGVAGMLAFGLSDDTTAAVACLGVTVGGIGLATAGVLVSGDGTPEKTAHLVPGLTLSTTF